MTYENYSLVHYITALIVISPHLDERLAIFLASVLVVLGTYALHLSFTEKNK